MPWHTKNALGGNTKKGALVVLVCDEAAGAHASAWPDGHIAKVLSDTARPIDAGAAESSGQPGLPGGRPAS